jgi:hypothetical protein
MDVDTAFGGMPFPEEAIDLSRCALPPFIHQGIGVRNIIRSPYFLLADEMGAGKTKQAIDAAQVLHVRGEIDKVLIISPAPVRSVWFDKDFGELRKHLWPDLCSMIIEYHKGKDRIWSHGRPFREPYLEWVITNYDYVRDGEGYDEIISYCDNRTMLVLDESSALKSHKAAQTKACIHIRNKCGRVLLLNGTPITHSPADMYSQGRLMHSSILDCKVFFDFRARYMVLGGWEDKQTIGWQNLEDLQTRFSPYVLRRLKKDCLDLPEKMPPVMFQVPMSQKLWSTYKEMRDSLVAWLSAQQVSVASQAIVKVLRLAQLTSGFIGGVEEESLEPIQVDLPTWLPFEDADPLEPRGPAGTVIVGSEKLDFYLDWLEQSFYKKPDMKSILWCRFKPELFRVMAAVQERFPHISTGMMYGGQRKGERESVKRMLDPRAAPEGALVVGSTLGTGSIGLTLTAADTNFYMSLNRVLLHLLQSIDRTHRPTQINPVNYYYLLATGPKGQKTVDHAIYGALEKREQLATWTVSAWVKALTEE